MIAALDFVPRIAVRCAVAVLHCARHRQTFEQHSFPNHVPGDLILKAVHALIEKVNRVAGNAPAIHVQTRRVVESAQSNHVPAINQGERARIDGFHVTVPEGVGIAARRVLHRLIAVRVAVTGGKAAGFEE